MLYEKVIGTNEKNKVGKSFEGHQKNLYNGPGMAY